MCVVGRFDGVLFAVDDNATHPLNIPETGSMHTQTNMNH